MNIYNNKKYNSVLAGLKMYINYSQKKIIEDFNK